MNGQMKNYNKYLKSLETMKEPAVPRAKLDLRGIMLYAQAKGVSVEELTRAEKDRFITYLEEKTYDSEKAPQ